MRQMETRKLTGNGRMAETETQGKYTQEAQTFGSRCVAGKSLSSNTQDSAKKGSKGDEKCKSGETDDILEGEIAGDV